MKRRIFLWTITVIIIISALNIKVTTRQGINDKISTFKIPLYLKVMDFFDRHYNYQWLTERITKGSKTEEEKALAIFKWTYENIKRIPPGYPSIDDHQWHIIVRGFGAADQSSDVFATLCNYAGMEAFYNVLYSEDRASSLPVSFVRLNKRWVLFDPYNGVYFKNSQGGAADVEDVMKEDWSTSSISGLAKDPGSFAAESAINYAIYFKNLSPVTEIALKRSNMQSPLRRLKYEIKKWMR